MHTNYQVDDRGTDAKTRHSKEDALDDREFELLLEGADRLDDYKRLQARFAIFAGGRFGLRPEEITHMRSSWLNTRDRQIEIPSFQACTKGRDGAICGACRQSARQMVECSDDGLTLDEALARAWQPKTDAGARTIPIDWDARAEIAVERFFERYDRWPLSRTGVNRRVTAAAQAAVEEIDVDRTYPHCLRATAASRLAAQGLKTLPLLQMLGWAESSTAEVYVARSPENTRRELHQLNSG